MDNTLARTRLEKTLKATTLDDLVRVKTSEHVFLMLDCSSSMKHKMRNGKTRIEGLREVVKGVQADRPCQMIAFGPNNGEGRTVFFVGGVPAPEGMTPLAEAILFAKEQNAGRVVVISDGWPDNPQAATEAAVAFGGQVDVVFVGDPGDPGAAFLKSLAEATGGTEFDGDLSEPKALTGAVIGLLNGDVDPDAAIAMGASDESEDADPDDDGCDDEDDESEDAPDEDEDDDDL